MTNHGNEGAIEMVGWREPVSSENNRATMVFDIFDKVGNHRWRERRIAMFRALKPA